MAGDFIDLIAWQQADLLSGEVYLLADLVRGPGAERVADQMRRAAESIPANIAEGYGRRTGADFARFLRIAGASAAELESHIRSAVTTRRLTAAQIAGPLARCRRVRALIRGLERAVINRDRKNPGRRPDAA